jgi:hypothetical protein
MMMKRRLIGIIAGSVILAGSGLGQNTGASVRLEKDAITIGDQIKVELNVTVPAGSLVQWPLLADTLARNVEILRKSGIDTVSSGKDSFTLKQEIVVTSFDSGYYAIRPVIFKYNLKGDTLTYLTETNTVNLDVQTIRTDASKDIKPIKPPLKAPVTFRELLPWIVLVLFLIAAAAAIYFFLKRRKKATPTVTTRLKPTIPPYEAAMEALDSLRNKKLWQSGRVKEYYSELTDIVREYIELRFPVRALEMTTGEINEAMRTTEVSDSSRDKLFRVLSLADLVKFAKEQPLPMENENCMNQSIEFVRETRPHKEILSEEADQKQNVEQPISR